MAEGWRRCGGVAGCPVFAASPKGEGTGRDMVSQSEVLNKENQIQFPKRHNFRKKKKKKRETQIDFHIKFPLL